MHSIFNTGLADIIERELHAHFRPHLRSSSDLKVIGPLVLACVRQALDGHTLIMDASDRMHSALAATTTPLVDFLARDGKSAAGLPHIPAFRESVATHATDLLRRLREEFLTGSRGPTPASPYLGNTRPVYEFVRAKLGVKMHGMENFTRFQDGFTQATIGQNVSLIYEVWHVSTLTRYRLTLHRQSVHSRWCNAGSDRRAFLSDMDSHMTALHHLNVDIYLYFLIIEAR